MQDQIKNLNNNFEFFPKINSSFTDKEEVLIPKMMSPEQIDKHYENRKNQEQKFTAIKQKIEKRRNQVYKMNLLGYTNEEIATNLGVSLSTIEKDLHYMKYYTKWTKEITQWPMSRALDASVQIEAAQCELWKLYRNETDKLTR